LDRKIPVIICVDAEPDRRLFDPGSREPWSGFERSYEFFSALRPRLAKVTGSPTHFSWFFRMDPQVEAGYGSPEWCARTYPKWIQDLKKNGDELGLHAHAWRWDEGGNRWIVDHGDQAWVDHCVDVSFRAFRRSFGFDCRSFRFGDAWMNNETVGLLEKLGARFDLTVESGKPPVRAERAKETVTGDVPDYTDTPKVPYRPSKHDYRKADPARVDGLWMIPVSGGNFPDRFWRKPKFRALRLAINPRAFARCIEKILKTFKKPILVPEVRVCATLHAQRFDHMVKNVEHLAAHKDARCFVFSTPSEALELLGYPPA
jgi:hypothetical protein